MPEPVSTVQVDANTAPITRRYVASASSDGSAFADTLDGYMSEHLQTAKSELARRADDAKAEKDPDDSSVEDDSNDKEDKKEKTKSVPPRIAGLLAMAQATGAAVLVSGNVPTVTSQTPAASGTAQAEVSGAADTVSGQQTVDVLAAKIAKATTTERGAATNGILTTPASAEANTATPLSDALLQTQVNTSTAASGVQTGAASTTAQAANATANAATTTAQTAPGIVVSVHSAPPAGVVPGATAGAGASAIQAQAQATGVSNKLSSDVAARMSNPGEVAEGKAEATVPSLTAEKPETPLADAKPAAQAFPAANTEGGHTPTNSDTGGNDSSGLWSLNSTAAPASSTAAKSVASSFSTMVSDTPSAQVSVHIHRAATDGLDRINFSLTPESLGRVDVAIKLQKDGLVTATITADNSDTLNLLKADASILQQALDDSGLKTDSGSLEFNLRGDQGSSGQGTPEPRRAPSLLSASMDDAPVTPTASASRYSSAFANSRLDIEA